jgi:hypothetical protein
MTSPEGIETGRIPFYALSRAYRYRATDFILSSTLHPHPCSIPDSGPSKHVAVLPVHDLRDG